MAAPRCHRCGAPLPAERPSRRDVCAGCGADLPRWVRLRLEELQDDKPALLDFGVSVVTRLCETLLRGGAPGLHFYTINQADPTLRLWSSLGLHSLA